MKPQDAIEEYLYECRQISPDTQRWYRQKLAAFQHWCEAEHLTAMADIQPRDILRFLDHLRQGQFAQFQRPLSTYTIRGYAQVIRGFLTWCGKDEIITDRARRRVEDLSMPKVDIKVIQTFSKEQIAALFAACDEEPHSGLIVRNKAILSLLFDTGIRAGELCGLTLEHTVFDADDPHVVVFGKGRKQRAVGPLGSKTRKHLRRYLATYRGATRGTDTVFVSHGGTTAGQPLTPDGLDHILYRLRDRASIEGVRCSAHTFRHTYACNYIEQGGDIFRLSRLLGHTNVAVTQNYLRAFNQRATRIGQSVLDGI